MTAPVSESRLGPNGAPVPRKQTDQSQEHIADADPRSFGPLLGSQLQRAGERPAFVTFEFVA